VGKNVYFENGLTFDDTPAIFADTSKVMTGVDVVMHEGTEEKIGLWRDKYKE
jgi:hypothetical protein